MDDKIEIMPLPEPSPLMLECMKLMRECQDEIRKVTGIDDLANLARHERHVSMMSDLQFFGHSLKLVRGGKGAY